MIRYKNDDEVNVYNDYEHNVYAPTFMNTGLDYCFPPKIYGEPQYVPVKWADLVRLKNSKIFTQKKLRFEPEKEEEIYSQLRVIFEKDAYSRKEMQDMIINVTDDIIREIMAIKDLKIIEGFLNEYIYLKNTNEYNLSNKLEMYIRAREYELKEEGLRISELEVTDSKDEKKEDIASAEAKAEEIVEEKEVKPKKPTRNTKAKEDK